MADLVTGDTGSKLVINCKDGSGVAINLTGASVRLIWEGADGVIKSKTMTIDNAVNGVVSYTFLAGEIFATKMVLEIEITDSGGKIVTCTDKIELTVREQIG